MAFFGGASTGRPAEHEAFFVSSPDLIGAIAQDGTLRSPNPAWTRLLALSADFLEGRPFLDLVHPDDRPSAAQTLDRLRRGELARASFECRLPGRDGTPRWVHWLGVAHEASRRLLLSGRDVTERREGEEKLRFVALHDPVTGLGNRALLVDRLRRLLTRARSAGGRVGLLCLDVDGFRSLSDSLGPAGTELLLFSVARRLESTVRPGDLLCRVGGDEFAVALDSLRDASDAGTVAGRVSDSLRSPVVVSARSLAITACVGAVVARPEEGADDVVAAAERLLTGARAQGTGQIAVRA